jgi:signal transduction histidine kinase
MLYIGFALSSFSTYQNEKILLCGHFRIDSSGSDRRGNILSNAIDALEEQNIQRSKAEREAQPSQITIQTRQVGDDRVAVHITDNGPGIATSVQQRLFDPFFTTKPVGKGTGMGMSISYQIITDRHKGTLHCNSELGQGTEFVIEIPVQQTNAAPVGAGMEDS